MSGMDFQNLLTAIGNREGVHDIACPFCGPQRHAPANRVRKVFRVWNTYRGFVTFYCARCGESGFASDGNLPPPCIDIRAHDSRDVLEQDRRAKSLSKSL